jgi:hypothetical protein
MAAGDAQRLLNDETLNQAFEFVRQTRVGSRDDDARRMTTSAGTVYILAAKSVEQTKAYLAAIISAENHELAQAKAARDHQLL